MRSLNSRVFAFNASSDKFDISGESFEKYLEGQYGSPLKLANFEEGEDESKAAAEKNPPSELL